MKKLIIWVSAANLVNFVKKRKKMVKKSQVKVQTSRFACKSSVN